jgi:circadian clock protein KaiC
MRARANLNPSTERSTIEKAPTGIAGLDEATHGGLPRGRLTMLFGGPGSGKTVLALQCLVHGAAQRNEPGIFVALEENSRQVVANAGSFGWDLPTLQKRKLFFLDASLRPNVVQAGKFELTALLSGLEVKVRAMGARRVVFDGIDVLLTLLRDESAERAELYRIHDWLLQHQLTGILTAKAFGPDPFAQPHYTFAAYMADCALALERRHAGMVSEREISIIKYRGSSFLENKAPFVIGPNGIEVAEQQASLQPTSSPSERLSTGVSRLNTMLKGGYFRGATTLITGLPGTAKTCLAGAFISAACQRGERALFVTFDEHGADTIRNLKSIGIQLQPFVDNGQLRILSALSLTDSSEIQLMRIRTAIRDQRASCVVVDPISALTKSSDSATAIGVLSRFVHWTKVNGITLVCTSLLSNPDPLPQALELGVSTLADTWLHVTYSLYGGERNRGLSIIKSRGTSHSNQVRELILSDDGISLTDVYESAGEVFMGSVRSEQENRRREEERHLSEQAQRRRIELERVRAELLARREVLQRELELAELDLENTVRGEKERQGRLLLYREESLRRRSGDVTDSPPTRPVRKHRSKPRGES